jgi:hypothetical protein
MEHAFRSVTAKSAGGGKHGHYHQRLMDVLFSQQPDGHVDFTYDYLSTSTASATAGSYASSWAGVTTTST